MHICMDIQIVANFREKDTHPYPYAVRYSFEARHCSRRSWSRSPNSPYSSSVPIRTSFHEGNLRLLSEKSGLRSRFSLRLPCIAPSLSKVFLQLSSTWGGTDIADMFSALSSGKSGTTGRGIRSILVRFRVVKKLWHVPQIYDRLPSACLIW